MNIKHVYHFVFDSSTGLEPVDVSSQFSSLNILYSCKWHVKYVTMTVNHFVYHLNLRYSYLDHKLDPSCIFDCLMSKQNALVFDGLLWLLKSLYIIIWIRRNIFITRKKMDFITFIVKVVEFKCSDAFSVTSFITRLIFETRLVETVIE